MKNRISVITGILVSSSVLLLAACGGGGGGNPLPQNAAPSASFSSSTDTARAPQTISFDGSASTDSDGSIVSYQWDFDGDFVMDFESAQPSADFLYAEVGIFNVTLQVRDNEGAVDTSSFAVTIQAPSFVEETLDGLVSETGDQAVMAQINGNPAIAYLDADDSLRYIRALDAEGQVWDAPVLVGTLADGPSLAQVDGQPAILFKDNVTGDLLFARALDAAGASWDLPLAITLLGTDPSLTRPQTLLIADGVPAALVEVALADQSVSAVLYVRASNPQGSAWLGQPKRLTRLGGNASKTTGLIVDGRPAAAYTEDGDLKFLRALDAAGDNWPPLGLVVSAGTGVENGIAFSIISGRPAMAYRDNALFYLRADDAAGDEWPSPLQVLSDAAAVAELPSLAEVGGFPCIAFENRTRDGLDLLFGLDSAGTAFGAPLAVDDGGIDSTALLPIGGKPALAYNLSDEEDLVYRLAE